MQREILFRGKNKSGEWVFGDLIQYPDSVWIRDSKDESAKLYIEVEPSTVGQYVGLVDKNNVKIFEGDKVRCLVNDKEIGQRDVVEFKSSAFGLRHRNISAFDWLNCVIADVERDFEVVGSIHD